MQFFQNHNALLILPIFLMVIIVSCDKDEPEDTYLPPGTTVYTAEEINTVPYSGADQVFKKSPDYAAELKFTFLERINNEEFIAWNQTYFQLGTDPYLKIELRLRYLQTESITYKTLAIYMPYWDDAGVIRSTIFEYPIEKNNFDNSFFENLVTFHDTLDIGPSTWLNVYELAPLTSTPESEMSDEDFSSVYYNSTYGIIAFYQKNGDQWVLHP